MLNQAKYSDRVAKLYEMFLDRPLSALDETVFYADRQIRHGDKGMFFKRKGIEQSLLEYHSVDFIVLVLVAIWIASK